MISSLSLHCPFCHAPEDERLEAKDEEGKDIILLMFDCPFHFRFFHDQVGGDKVMQQILDDWRNENGEAWLESLGPIMKKREIQNIERFNSAVSA
jgi:hypothetical protein